MATRIRSGRWIAVLAAACTATLAVVSTSGAATRSSGPMTYVTASGEAFANQSTALLSALCPEGSRATAAGASIEGTRKSRQIFEFNLIDNIDDGDEADNGVTVAASNMTNGTPTLKQTALFLRSDEDSLGYFGYSDSDDFASIGSYQTAQPFIPCVLGAEWAIGAGVGIEGPGEDVRVHSLY